LELFLFSLYKPKISTLWHQRKILMSKTGKGLDIPGAEEDDKMEEIGEEDEENNYWSLSDNDDDHEEENDDVLT